jgi:RecA-family ATPase
MNIVEKSQQPYSMARTLRDSTANRLFVGKSKPVKWLVEGVLPLGKPIIVASPPGVGKSYLALKLAVEVASAPSHLKAAAFCFGGQVKAHGRVVIVSAEDDHEELHRRLEALTDTMPDKLHVVSLPDTGHFSFLHGDPRIGMSATPQWADLKTQIAALGDVRLVVFDTLQALSSGDLNAAEIAQMVMNELTEVANSTSAAVIALHHLTKGTSAASTGLLSGPVAMDAIRGSGAIVGAVRVAYCLFPHPQGQKVCEALGIDFEENKVVYGLVAKANGKARRDRTIYIRHDNGVLEDRTMQYKHAVAGDDALLDRELLAQIISAHEAGEGYAASSTSKQGLHRRRNDMPAQFHALSAAWFQGAATRLIEGGHIEAKRITNGNKLVPAPMAVTSEMPYAAMPSEGPGDLACV